MEDYSKNIPYKEVKLSRTNLGGGEDHSGGFHKINVCFLLLKPTTIKGHEKMSLCIFKPF